MGKKKNVVILGLILLLIFYFSPKGLLIPANAEEVSFGNNTSDTFPCPSGLKVKAEYYQHELSHFVNFTISLGEDKRVNITLEGVFGEYICVPEGILVYSYYPGDPVVDSNLAFFDYNLSERWKREFPARPLKYTKDGLILVSNPTFGSSGSSCVYVMKITTGRLLNWLCPDVLGGHVSDVKITDGRIYVTIGEPRRPPLKTYALIYMKEGEKVKKAEITSIPGEGVGIRLLIDAKGKYVAVAYFLANERGEEKNGVCVFRAENLKKIACKEFDEGENPEKIKLEESIVYVQTPWEVKAYRIFSLW